jgi:hypothetical protein
MNYHRKKSSGRLNKTEPLKKLIDIKKKVRERFINEHKTSTNSYFIKVVNDIIYNEKTQLVSNFKEYLIFDDCSEFLRR